MATSLQAGCQDTGRILRYVGVWGASSWLRDYISSQLWSNQVVSSRFRCKASYYCYNRVGRRLYMDRQHLTWGTYSLNASCPLFPSSVVQHANMLSCHSPARHPPLGLRRHPLRGLGNHALHPLEVVVDGVARPFRRWRRVCAFPERLLKGCAPGGAVSDRCPACCRLVSGYPSWAPGGRLSGQGCEKWPRAGERRVPRTVDMADRQGFLSALLGFRTRRLLSGGSRIGLWVMLAEVALPAMRAA